MSSHSFRIFNLHIYIYIYWQHFFVNTDFIKHNRHFMSTYFLLDPFEFPYYFYRIWGELIYVLSIVVCNFCFSILLLCKSVVTVEDYGVCF